MSTTAYTYNDMSAHSGAEERFLDRNQLSDRWGVSKETLKRREKAGHLPAVRFNSRTVRYRLSDVLRIEADADVRQEGGAA